MLANHLNPLDEMVTLLDSMDPVYEQSLAHSLDDWPGLMESVSAIPIDLYERNHCLIIQANLPGLSDEDIDVSIIGHTLKIQGEFPEDEAYNSDRLYLKERSSGKFQRVVALPDRVDAADMEVNCTEGILKIVLPTND